MASIPRVPSSYSSRAGLYSTLPLSAEDEKRKLQEKDGMYSVNMNDRERQSSSGSSGSSSGQSSSHDKDKERAVEEKPASRGMVVFSVLFYLVAALVMIMANKWVLNSVQVPLFFLFVQLAIAVLLLHLSAVFGYFTIPTIQLSTCRALLPLISINVTGLIFNTYCLQYVDASFYQVARGLVLPFTVFFSYLLLSSRSSFPSLLAVGFVCAGFLLGVWGEHLHTSPIGTTLGVFSSLTTSVHAIVVKRSLGVVKGSTMDLVYYNNLLSALLLSPLVFLSGEWTSVLSMLEIGGKPLETFVWGATITGVFGFLICIAGFLSIKVTSPVTHMISSAVRGVIQTFLGMWCFGDVVTVGRGSGILFILLGSMLYTYVKDREARAKEAIASHGRRLSDPPPSVNNNHPQQQHSYQPVSGSTSAHNSPVLSSSATFGPNLGININLANASSSSSGLLPSPRSPRRIVSSDMQNKNFIIGAEVMQTPGSSTHPSSATGHRLSPSNSMQPIGGNPGLPSRRLSYDGRRTDSGYAHGIYASPPSAMASSQQRKQEQQQQQQHGKSMSVSDLKDILIAPNNDRRWKEEKAY